MKDDRTGANSQIIVAIIGVVGVLGAALFANWSSIFPPQQTSSVASQKSEINSPKVIATTPTNGAIEVDPFLSKITVTFDKPMRDNSWSWSKENARLFPKVTGEPTYVNNETTCVLPVALEEGKRYTVWINKDNFQNFKDTNGVPVEPYKFEFKTK